MLSKVPSSLGRFHPTFNEVYNELILPLGRYLRISLTDVLSAISSSQRRSAISSTSIEVVLSTLHS